MSKRFSVRKIKINSYSRQGWVMSHRESFAVYDRLWKEVAKSRGLTLWDGKKLMYIPFTEFNNKDFVKAVAEHLNKTVGDDVTQRVDGYRAHNEVLARDLGDNSKISCYHEWCDKFSTGFRPTEKFQKV